MNDFIFMKKIELITRDGKAISVDSLAAIASDSRLCNDLFGTSVPRNLTVSKTIAWADALFRDRVRQVNNYRAVWRSHVDQYALDATVNTHVKSLTAAD